MCGICGYVDFSTSSKRGSNSIEKMIAAIGHRGPDASGRWESEHINIGHARLSILDLSELGNQPMHSKDGRYSIVYNGEIYNYQEIKSKLVQKGHSFRSKSDTEVFLKAFEIFNTDAFAMLNGIFTAFIWDTQKQVGYLVRDRFGVKPLYYKNIGEKLIFGSEIKSILKASDTQQKMDPQAFHEFLFYGNTIGENTLFENIYKLTPGTYLIIQKSGVQQKTFWSPKNIKLNYDISIEDAVSTTTRLLDEAVQRQLVSDVPVGVFLSGGIDSTAVTAFATKHYSNKLNTFSASFDFEIVNELEKARTVANHYGTEHHELFIKGKELPEIISKLVKHHDEPFSDAANIPLYLLSKEVSNTHKVILQGDGGDEFFGGYKRYQTLSKIKYYRPLSKFLNTILAKGFNAKTHRLKRYFNALSKSDDGLMMALLLTIESDFDSPIKLLSQGTKNKLINTNPFEEYMRLNKEFSNLDIVQRMLWIDSQIILPNTFLEKVDKSTMANSIEVRVPFLDNALSEFAMSLSSNQKIKKGEKKWLLRESLRGIVPNSILDAPKTGFGVPYSNWLKGPLSDFFNDTINSTSIVESGLFEKKHLDKMVKEHNSNLRDNGFILWKILNFCIWFDEYDVSF